MNFWAPRRWLGSRLMVRPLRLLNYDQIYAELSTYTNYSTGEQQCIWFNAVVSLRFGWNQLNPSTCWWTGMVLHRFLNFDVQLWSLATSQTEHLATLRHLENILMTIAPVICFRFRTLMTWHSKQTLSLSRQSDATSVKKGSWSQPKWVATIHNHWLQLNDYTIIIYCTLYSSH